MDVYGKSAVAVAIAAPGNVVYMSTILGRDAPTSLHKCDWKCSNEHVCGNMYRCRLTGLTHICDKNCNQRILYDNHSSLCRASRQIFPLSPSEQQAVRGVRRKLDAENSPSESCSFKRRRDAPQLHPSSFERSFSAVSADNSPSESCSFKRRHDASQLHPSPFERSFSAVSPICSQADAMEMN